MIEVQFIGGAADYAFAAITLPHRQFYSGRDDPAPHRIGHGRRVEVLIALDCHKSELEH